MIGNCITNQVDVLVSPHCPGVRVFLIVPVARRYVPLQPVQAAHSQLLLVRELQDCLHKVSALRVDPAAEVQPAAPVEVRGEVQGVALVLT
ncbi:hypothetical protein D3C78_1651450 [compost metagenome]